MSKKIFFSSWLFIAALGSAGCNPARAPDVPSPPSRQGEPAVQELAADCNDRVNLTQFQGTVRVPLELSTKGGWIYWQAGSSAVVEAPSDSCITSNKWDLRISRGVPLVGSNGGEMARDFSTTGVAQFAVWPESDSGSPETALQSSWPIQIAQVSGLNFSDDRYQSICFKSMCTGEEYHSPLVNAIPSGLASDYVVRHGLHMIVLSNRIFVLKKADGSGFVSVRFSYYNPVEKYLEFQWRTVAN